MLKVIFILISFVLASESQPQNNTSTHNPVFTGGYLGYGNTVQSTINPTCVDCVPHIALAQMCMISICENSPVSSSYSEVKNDIKKDPNLNSYENEIKKTILDSAKNDLKNTIQKIKDLIAKIENKDITASLSDDELYLIPVSFIGSDTDSLRQDLKETSEQFSKVIMKHFKSISESYTNDPEVTLKQLYPNLSFADAIKEMVKEIDRKLGKLKSEGTPFSLFIYKSINSNPYLQAVRRNQEINIKDSSQIIMDDLSISILNDIKNDKAIKEIAVRFARESLKEIIYNPDTLRMLKETLNELIKFNNDQKNIESLYRSCFADYAVARLGLPKKDKLVDLKQNVHQIKNSYIDSVSKLFSAHSNELIKKDLDKIDFIMPQSTEDFKDSSKKMINREIENSQISFHEIPEVEILSILLNRPEHETAEEFIFDYALETINQDDCEDINPPIISDGAYTMTGDIRVSWGSLIRPEALNTVLAHEFGHVLFQSLTTLPLSNETAQSIYPKINCLNDNHGDDPKNTLKEKIAHTSESGEFSPVILENKYYTSEDFADLISAYLNKDSRKNLGCYLTNGHSMLPGYYPHISLKHQSEESDDHSTGLFRILAVETHLKGNLPKECTDLAARQNLEFKSCMPKQVGAK